MFQIFLKKQQYTQVSSKFKNHFQQRGDKVNFVNSLDNKIQDKMRVFKDLINDGAKPQKKSVTLQPNYFREHRKLKANQLYEREVNELGHMTDGFIEWENAKLQKSKHKENVFSWGHYKDEKQKRKIQHETNLGEVMKEKLQLRELRVTNRSGKFQTQIKAKIENNIFDKQKRRPFHMSCRQSPEKEEYIVEMMKEKEQKRNKLKKYFGHMREYSFHGKVNSEPSTHELKPLRSLEKTMNSTAHCTPFDMKGSGLFAPPFEDISRIKEAQNYEVDAFADDKIYEEMRSRFSQGESPRDLSMIPKEELNVIPSCHKMEMVRRNLKEIKKLPLKTVNILRAKAGFDLPKSVFRSTAHCPFNTDKLNAVMKVQCL